MKYKLLLVLLLFIGNSLQAQKIHYKIEGKLDCGKNGTVELIHKGKIEKSALIKNGQFYLEGESRETSAYYLNFGNELGIYSIFLENDLISVSSKTEDSFNEILIHSNLNSKYYEWRLLERKLNENTPYSDIVYQFVSQNPKSYIALFILAKNKTRIEMESLKNLLSILKRQFHNSPEYLSLIDFIRIKETIKLGAKIPDLVGETLTGKKLELTSHCTLIDFWASWCGPCIQTIPELKKLYESYSHRGFEIIGVSLDHDKEKWRKSVDKMNLNWQHISDLKGWDSLNAKKFAVNSVPRTFLIDHNGRIIGINLSHKDLEKKLMEILN